MNTTSPIFDRPAVDAAINEIARCLTSSPGPWELEGSKVHCAVEGPRVRVWVERIERRETDLSLEEFRARILALESAGS